MKNPMTPEEMKQAIDDNAAGHDMQYRNIGNEMWLSRFQGKPLNFADNEYRRKPEPMVRYTHIVSDDLSITSFTLQQALDSKIVRNGKGTIHRLVEDPDWVEPKSEPEEKNPWRPIINREWPECKPEDIVIIKNESGNTVKLYSCDINWFRTDAVEWKYAEADKIRHSED